MAAKRQSLGKGLDALLGIPEDAETLQDQAVIDSSQELLAQTLADAVSPADGSLQNLPVEFLHPGQYQPRRDLNSEALQELADSIATQDLKELAVQITQICNEQY